MDFIMTTPCRLRRTTLIALLILQLAASPLAAQAPAREYEPTVGQPGKDVVWVPNTPIMVEKMLDLAKVTPEDFVVDLGSGDGRNVIAAARRGARALGVEYNPDLVGLSRRNAERAGVADKASFVEADMFEADFSQATVLALFLLTTNLERLRPKFLDLQPGTRIVANTFAIPGWEPDVTEKVEGECTNWCTAMLWIVPAKVAGTWRLGKDTLVLDQQFQKVSGTMSSGERVAPLDSGELRGEEISFAIGDTRYTGRVKGDSMAGTLTSGASTRKWQATRVPG
jgi:SAM-dependent methyltransferase